LLIASKGHRIDIDVSPSNLSINGDRNLLSQVINNLLSNAIKYTPPKGTIKLIARDEDSDVKISVQDRGIGIPKKEFSKIFDRFYQVDDPKHRQHEGTGLGLSLVKGIIERHKGKIWVESKVGKGSIFHLTLPKVQAA